MTTPNPKALRTHLGRLSKALDEILSIALDVEIGKVKAPAACYEILHVAQLALRAYKPAGLGGESQVTPPKRKRG